MSNLALDFTANIPLDAQREYVKSTNYTTPSPAAAVETEAGEKRTLIKKPTTASDVATSLGEAPRVCLVLEVALVLIATMGFLLALYHEHTMYRMDFAYWLAMSLAGGVISTLHAGFSVRALRANHNQHPRAFFGCVSTTLYVILVARVWWLAYAVLYMDDGVSGTDLFKDLSNDSIRIGHGSNFVEVRLLSIFSLIHTIFLITMFRTFHCILHCLYPTKNKTD